MTFGKSLPRAVDYGDFLEVQSGYAPNLVVGFARVVGRSVGIVANQPSYLAGVLDINSSVKASRFVRFCNAFNIPLVTFVDVPGFLPGVQQEHGGHHPPRRKNALRLFFGNGTQDHRDSAQGLRRLLSGDVQQGPGSDRVFAWPTAEVAVMGAKGAAEIVFRKEISSAEDPAAKRQELIQTYREAFSNPDVAAGRRLVDDVIDPADTRRVLAQSLRIWPPNANCGRPKNTDWCPYERRRTGPTAQ